MNPSKKLVFDEGIVDISDIEAHGDGDKLDYYMLDATKEDILDASGTDWNEHAIKALYEPYKTNDSILDSIINISVTLSSSSFSESPIEKNEAESMRLYEEQVSFKSTPMPKAQDDYDNGEEEELSSTTLSPEEAVSNTTYKTPARPQQRRLTSGTPFYRTPHKSASSVRQTPSGAFSPVSAFGAGQDEDYDEDFVGHVSPNRTGTIVGPSRPVTHAFVFEIFEDVATPAKFIPRENVAVKRMFGATPTHAAEFAMRVCNVSHGKEDRSKFRITRTMVTKYPIVAPEGSMEPGHCKFSFFVGAELGTAKENDEHVIPEPLPDNPFVGVVVLDTDFFMTKNVKPPFVRTEILTLDPMMLVPTRQHVTILTSSEVSSFMALDHFIIDLFTKDDLRVKMVSLAIHKHVFIYLLVQNATSIPFTDIEITPNGDKLSMVMHVRRIRRHGKRILVAIERIDFFVRNGFERIRFVDSPRNKKRCQSLFDASINYPGNRDDDEDESFGDFVDTLKEMIFEPIQAISSTRSKEQEEKK